MQLIRLHKKTLKTSVSKIWSLTGSCAELFIWLGFNFCNFQQRINVFLNEQPSRQFDDCLVRRLINVFVP